MKKKIYNEILTNEIKVFRGIKQINNVVFPQFLLVCTCSFYEFSFKKNISKSTVDLYIL